MKQENVRALRKALDLSQEEFGKRIGVTKSAISGVETNTRPMGNQMFKSICNAFPVNPAWLETGQGKMLLDADENLSDMVDKMLAEDGLAKRLISVMAKMNPEQWRVASEILVLFSQTKK